MIFLKRAISLCLCAYLKSYILDLLFSCYIVVSLKSSESFSICLISIYGVNCLEVPAKNSHLIFFCMKIMIRLNDCRRNLCRPSNFYDKTIQESCFHQGNLAANWYFQGVCRWLQHSAQLKKTYFNLNLLIKYRFVLNWLNRKLLNVVAQQLKQTLRNDK